mmetsp:Transcript_33218/g.91562  ORF Transcript_33218/g.91562 Transcript_33218/m.91562 type:complete len:556 (-) Transcript_33218:148-1815(-)
MWTLRCRGRLCRAVAKNPGFDAVAYGALRVPASAAKGLPRGALLRDPGPRYMSVASDASSAAPPGVGDASSSAGPAISVGADFLKDVEQRRQRLRVVEDSSSFEPRQGTDTAEETVTDPQKKNYNQLMRLFKRLPGHVSLGFAYLMHKKGQLEPKGGPLLSDEEFESLYTKVKFDYQQARRRDVTFRRRRKRNYQLQNTGYSEVDETHDAEEEEFLGPWRTESMKEDYWKAEYYHQLHSWTREFLPEREPLAMRTDRVADIVGATLRKHIADTNRPVLTHELADFENPFMMKHSAKARILHERCVRNQLDERCLPRLLEKQPDLIKLRARAALPPEVLEPLAAFRGDVSWNFDPQVRLSQKLGAVDTTLAAVLDSKGDVAMVADALPENAPTDPGQVPGVHHPWRNHVGFESAVPRGRAGGMRMGQPEPALKAQILKLRYPTLQRVAHTLPADPKWRAHTVRTIQVLERSKHWDFESKLRAVNSMKEIYEQIKGSAEYTAALDEKLPVNRTPSHIKRKYAPDAQYVKTYPRRFIWQKTNTRYRASLTATAPLKKR